MKEETLIFVYNANGDLFSTVTDYVHKVLSPQTYACSLCQLTHSHFGMKKQWKDFLRQLPLEKEFIYKDDFGRMFPAVKEVNFPAVFLRMQSTLTPVMTAEELKTCRSITELETMLVKKLKKR